MTKDRKVAQRPTVQRLLHLLADTPVRVVVKLPDGDRGYYDDERDVIVVSKRHADKADGMTLTVIHELLHKWYDVDHDDHRDRHRHIWPGEMEFFASVTLRDKVRRRLLNSCLYGMTTEWRRVGGKAKRAHEGVSAPVANHQAGDGAPGQDSRVLEGVHGAEGTGQAGGGGADGTQVPDAKG